jgi:hypothetical protein
MDPRTRIVTALVEGDGSLRRAGMELIVDHVLAEPLSTWLDVDSLTRLIVDALSHGNSARTIERHVLPGLARVQAALGASGERVGDAVPEQAHADIDALVTHPGGPRFAWLRGALDRDKLRVLIAPALQEVLVSFAARIPLAGREGGGGGAASIAAGLVGQFGRSTGERLRNLGKSVADGLGVDIEAKLRDAARDASQGAVSVLERAITARMATPEGEKLVAALARSVLEHVLATPISVILEDLDRLPLEAAVRIAAPILEHDVARELWRTIIREEVRAVLVLEGARSVRELLEEAGLLRQVRTLILERADRVAHEFFRSQGFAAWLDRLLTSA